MLTRVRIDATSHSFMSLWYSVPRARSSRIGTSLVMASLQLPQLEHP